MQSRLLEASGFAVTEAPVEPDRPPEAEATHNRLAAQALARMEVADAVVAAMADFDGSLRDFQRQSGIDAAVVSRLMNQHHKQGGTVATLAQIALALGKTLKITID